MDLWWIWSSISGSQRPRKRISNAHEFPELDTLIIDVMLRYLHRSGRCGRFGRPGTCITLLEGTNELDEIRYYGNQEILILMVLHDQVPLRSTRCSF